MGDEIHRTIQSILISPVKNSNISLLDNEGCR